ncbi:hypothetical protein [Gemmatimonas sp.]|uniref:hypothetical protein n=1 Tax=Gemmatimonas sp. TaxID=1962908 RepID=UPI00356704C4
MRACTLALILPPLFLAWKTIQNRFKPLVYGLPFLVVPITVFYLVGIVLEDLISFGRAIDGTSDWLLYSVVLDVPGNPVGITIGALLNGVGTARVDDMRFEVVDGTVATTGTSTAGAPTLDSTATTNFYARLPSRPENLDFEGVAPFASSTAAWLNSVAKPFSTDAPGSGFDDLAEIGAIVGNARVVAFGEATHGTREFFRMKHRAFEYLVERQGFTHFSIEATMPESRAMETRELRHRRAVTRFDGGLVSRLQQRQEVVAGRRLDLVHRGEVLTSRIVSHA